MGGGLMEANTISPNELTELDDVLAHCDGWKRSRHYPHNTCEIIDYLAEQVKQWRMDAWCFQQSSRGLRERLDGVEQVLDMIATDTRCVNQHDSMAREGLAIAIGQLPTARHSKTRGDK